MNVPCFRAFVIQANVDYSNVNQQPNDKCDRLNNYIDNVTDHHIANQSHVFSTTDESRLFSHILT